jgi:hypothetical protein
VTERVPHADLAARLEAMADKAEALTVEHKMTVPSWVADNRAAAAILRRVDAREAAVDALAAQAEATIATAIALGERLNMTGLSRAVAAVRAPREPATVSLPEFPVDDLTLAAVESSIREHFDLGYLLDFMAGIDQNDTSQVEATDDPQHFIDHRDHYHPNDVICALIAEVRRLRAVPREPGESPMAGRVPHADREALAARLDRDANAAEFNNRFDGAVASGYVADLRAAAAELRQVDAREAAARAMADAVDAFAADEGEGEEYPAPIDLKYAAVLAAVAAYRALTEEPTT